MTEVEVITLRDDRPLAEQAAAWRKFRRMVRQWKRERLERQKEKERRWITR